jgi:opacity protein-like surface antigen
MKVLTFLACAGLTVAAWPAAAADLLGSAPPLTMPASQGPTTFEVGSNWYIRGDLGISFDEAPTVSLSSISTPPPGLVAAPYTTPAGTNWSTTNFTGGVGAGYRFNDYLRFDATWDYSTGPGGTRNTAVVCPYPPTTGIYSLTTGLPAGNLYNASDVCNGATNLKQYNNAFLANGYVDLGTYGGFTPYVGGGLGACPRNGGFWWRRLRESDSACL